MAAKKSGKEPKTKDGKSKAAAKEARRLADEASARFTRRVLVVLAMAMVLGAMLLAGPGPRANVALLRARVVKFKDDVVATVSPSAVEVRLLRQVLASRFF